jgi:nitrite reductase (NADH) small subunit
MVFFSSRSRGSGLYAIGMAWTKVGPAAALPPGSVSEVTIGDKLFAICNVEGTIYAMDGFCPHSNGPLGYGTLYGSTLVCPLHAWEFDCRTGEDLSDPANCVQTFPAKVVEGQILVDIP